MQIEIEKFYRTRGGHVAGPIERDDWGDGCPYVYTDEAGHQRWVNEKGKWVEGVPTEHDLIEEVKP